MAMTDNINVQKNNDLGIKDSNIRRIAVVGFGNLGQYLVKAILNHKDLELAFVWNRTCKSLMGHVADDLVLKDLSKFAEREVDLIVEVAHPCITDEFGEKFLEHADYMIGSPTTFANAAIREKIFAKASSNSQGHGLYIPSGAFWGAQDVRKMADRGTLRGLMVTMKKTPSSFKLSGELKAKNDQVTNEAVVLYSGPVKDICPIAPNNVNTMAVAAIAAHNLGFEGVQGRLVADPSLDCHIVEIEIFGPGDDGSRFHVKTVRTNPAKSGAVTGSATYSSFLSSLLVSRGQGSGVHLS